MAVTLTAAALQLSELTVKAGSSKAVRSFGAYQGVRLPPTLDFCPNTASTLYTFVENETDQAGTIRTLHYRLSPRKSAILIAYATRLHVLADSITPTGRHLPGRELLVQNQVVLVKPTDKSIHYTLEQPTLFPDNGVWVAIEMMGYVDRDGIFQQLSDHAFGESIYSRKEGIRLLAPYFAMKKHPAVTGLIRHLALGRYTSLTDQTPMFGLTATF